MLAERPHGSLERPLEKDLSLISISVPPLIAKCFMGQLLQLPALLFSLAAWTVKNPPAMKETRVQFLTLEDPLEKGMATHSSILAWRIP